MEEKKTAFSKKFDFPPWLAIAALMLLSWKLMTWGINWGIGLNYHPDELALLRVILNQFVDLQMDLSDWMLTQPLFHVKILSSLFRVFLGEEQVLYLLANNNTVPLYLLGRKISAVFALVTIPVTYLLGKELYNKKVGLLAATFLAICPIIIWNSHYLYNDIPAMLWVTLTLLFSAKILKQKEGEEKMHWYLLAGICAVFSFTTKANAGIAFLFPFAAEFLRFKTNSETKISFKELFSKIKEAKKIFWNKNLAYLLAMLIALPFLLSPNLFDMFQRYTTKFFASGGTEAGVEIIKANPWMLTKLVYSTIISPQFILGVALFLSVALGTLLLLHKRRKEDLLLLSFILPYLFIVGITWLQIYYRYLIPLVPVATICAALLFEQLWKKGAKMDKIKTKNKTSHLGPLSGYFSYKKLAAALLIFVLVYTAAFTTSTTHRFTEDNRDFAADWILSFTEPGASIVSQATFTDGDSVRLPGELNLGEIPNSLAELETNPPDYIVFTTIADKEYFRYIEATEENLNKRAVREEVRGGQSYELVKSFDSKFINKGYYRFLDPYFEGFYISPTVEIYKKIS